MIQYLFFILTVSGSKMAEYLIPGFPVLITLSCVIHEVYFYSIRDDITSMIKLYKLF